MGLNKQMAGRFGGLLAGKALLLSTVGGVGLMSAPVHAQGYAVGLEEIVVTSRKRSESLFDIPDTVNAFSELAIESAGIESIDDALALTPNFEMRNDQQPGVYTMTARGVSTVRNGEPPVAFVIDGVTLPSSNAFTQELFDIERIEILKGPQGALYGRNAIGGAINVVTKRPSNDVEGAVKVRGGKGNDFKITGSASGPLVEDKVFARLAGYYHNTDGLLDNVYLNEDADWEESFGLRGRVIVDASENLTLDFRGGYSELDAGSAYYVNTDSSFGSNATGVIQSDVDGNAHVKNWNLAAKVDWTTDAGTLTSITSYNDYVENAYQDIDWTPMSFLQGHLVTDVEGFTQEVRFTSPDDQPLRWFVGGFYQESDRYRLTHAFVNLNFVLNGNGDPASKMLIDAAVAPQVQDYKSYSLFGQVNYDLAEDLELTFALRWDKDDRTDFQANSAPGGLLQEGSFDEIQPKLSIAWNATEDLLLYGTYARGYRPGGFNPPNTIQQAYASETLNSFELGFKGELADGRVRVSGAMFYIDYTDQQFFLLEVTPDGGLVQLLANGKSSDALGFELELAAQVTEGLSLSAGLGYTDGEVGDFGTAANFPGGTDRFDGMKLPNTSEYSINLTAQYRHPLTDAMDLVARADYKRQGKTYWALDNVDVEPAYDIVDLRLGVETDSWRLTGFVKNAFDEKYTVQSFIKEFSGFVTDTAWPSKPVSWGIEASYSF